MQNVNVWILIIKNSVNVKESTNHSSIFDTKSGKSETVINFKNEVINVKIFLMSSSLIDMVTEDSLNLFVHLQLINRFILSLLFELKIISFSKHTIPTLLSNLSAFAFDLFQCQQPYDTIKPSIDKTHGRYDTYQLLVLCIMIIHLLLHIQIISHSKIYLRGDLFDLNRNSAKEMSIMKIAKIYLMHQHDSLEMYKIQSKRKLLKAIWMMYLKLEYTILKQEFMNMS